MDLSEIFTRNLKRYREKRGLTRKQLSALCNVDRTYIGKIERNQRSPTLKTIMRLARALEVPPKSLFEDPPPEIESPFETMAENAITALFITSPEHRFEFVNRAFLDATGYDRSEVLGKKANLLKSGEHPPGYYRNMIRVLHSGEMFEDMLVNQRKDGSLFYVRERIKPVTTNGRDIQYYVTNWIEVTSEQESS